MRMKKNYKSPCILKRVIVQLESGFLQGSVVTKNTKIRTAGQDVDSHTITSEQGFNTQWE